MTVGVWDPLCRRDQYCVTPRPDHEAPGESCRTLGRDLFGQAKMVELVQKRDRTTKQLADEQTAQGGQRVRSVQALEAVPPRRFDRLPLF
jgi:hypothetical protein